MHVFLCETAKSYTCAMQAFLMTMNTKLREYTRIMVNECVCQAYEDFWIWARHLNFQADTHTHKASVWEELKMQTEIQPNHLVCDLTLLRPISYPTKRVEYSVMKWLWEMCTCACDICFFSHSWKKNCRVEGMENAIRSSNPKMMKNYAENTDNQRVIFICFTENDILFRLLYFVGNFVFLM